MGEGLKDVFSRKAGKDATFAAHLKAALGGDAVARDRVLAWLTGNVQEAVEEFVQRKFRHTANTAQDLAQKAFISLWNGIRDGRGDPNLLPPDFFEWLMCLVYKHSLDQLKIKARKQAFDASLPDERIDPAAGGLTQAMKNEKAKKLKRAIGSLEPQHQQLAMAYLEHDGDWEAIGTVIDRSGEGARALFRDFVRPALESLVKTALIDRTALQKRAASAQGKPLRWADVEAAAAKANLNCRYVEILRLRLRDGLANADVAKKLGLPPATSDHIYSVARAHLKPHLTSELPRGRVQP